jgi:methyl-accepting chemotaxis protein
MKITTRLISSYTLFFAIMAGLVLYQVITIDRLQSVIRALSGSSFQSGLACLQALRDGNMVEEYAAKYFAAADDPDNLKNLQESQEAFESSLREIRSSAKSNEELIEVKRLSQLWDSYVADQEQLLLQKSPRGGSMLPESLQNDLEQLHAQTLTVYQVSLQAMSLQAERFRKAGETAVQILLYTAIAALAIVILGAFLTIRSISKPLARLMEGTRSIAEGKSFYRLDTSRRDELSELARDVNTIAGRLNEQNRNGKA